jgi:predicted Zn-dependent protease
VTPTARNFQVALPCALLLALAGCGARLATSSGEARVGAEEAAEVEQTIGLADAPALATYLDEIGQRLVASSPRVRTDFEYKFRIVDLPDPNAFALPGGIVYVSRGLLALLNGEDELANVVGHEIAHVAARHHLKAAIQETPFVPVRIATGLAAGLLELATLPLGPLAAPVRPVGAAVSLLGEAPGALYLAGFSRAQESEADALGQELAAGAGWDPAAMASVMVSLGRDERLHGGDPGRLDFFATHPSTPDREQRTRERAAALTRGAAPEFAHDRAHFLAELAGLLVGDSAQGGVVDGRRFLHADLDFQLSFPNGWKVENGANNVSAIPADAKPDQPAPFASLAVADKGDDPEPVARALLAKSSFEPDTKPETVSIGALRAVRVSGRDRSTRTPYRAIAHWIAHKGLVFQVIAAAPERGFESHRKQLEAVAKSFRPLAPANRARVVEARLRLVESRPGETLAALLARAPGAWKLPALAAANALPEDAVFDAARPVKNAVLERYPR